MLFVLHYTEWSASYTPADPIHDSYHEAAYVLQKLKQVGKLFMIVAEPARDMQDVHHFLKGMHREVVQRQAVSA